MHISPYTVEDYRETLFKKFGLKNKTELILFALKHKLVEQGISNQPLAMSR
ncbi:LuxR C-terminal-related transcriptional regulator [Terrimonas sp.]|uniref:LuxR C-terminal-related transcriptional regulator n=1 Tax=Terrimonas sp. TaxID=1914338 RepID=UPI00351A33D1